MKSALDLALLDYAAAGNCGEVIKALNNGANAQVKNSQNQTALHLLALQTNNSEIKDCARTLTEYGCPTRHRDDHGKTALQYAATTGAYEAGLGILQNNLSALDDLDTAQKTSFALTLSRSTDMSAFDALLNLSRKIDLTRVRGSEGETLLMCTAKNNATMMSFYFFCNNTDLNETPNPQGEKPVAECARLELWGHVRSLVNAGVRLDARDKDGRTLDEMIRTGNGFLDNDWRNTLLEQIVEIRKRTARQILRTMKGPKP